MANAVLFSAVFVSQLPSEYKYKCCCLYLLFAAFLAFVDFQMGKLPSAFYPTVITSKLCISVACSKCSHFFDVSMNQFFYFDAVVKSRTVEVYILLFSPPCGKLELQIPRCHVPAST